MSKIHPYRRIMLKISGEALMGNAAAPFDPEFLDFLAKEVHKVREYGCEIGIVPGGGNIFRGAANSLPGVDRITGDHMGMLATLINCLVLSAALEAQGCPTRILSPFAIPQIAETMSYLNARRVLDDGFIALFAGGTGNPFFTTDSAAVLRALEAGCEVVFKATKVDGVFDSDPAHNPKAAFLPHLTFSEALSRNIAVMDRTAFSLCQEHQLPIVVFNINRPDNILRAARGESIGSVVDNQAEK